jgi:UDP-N-acetylglucosamine 2-epimerase (non-hydrolysing)
VIVAICGTTGSLIKFAPLLRRLHERGSPALMMCTGQQIEQIPALLSDFGVPQPDVWLRRRAAHDLQRSLEIPGWFADVLARFARSRRKVRSHIRGSATRPMVLVHGDTLTTIVGAFMGRALRAPVGHVEAGMRSRDWRNPFPEEVIRRWTAKVAEVHYAPGPIPLAHLRDENARGEIVDTGENTIRDALELTKAAAAAVPSVELPSEPFGIVSLHRFELLESREALSGIISTLRIASRRTPLVFVDHPVTAAAVESAGLQDAFDERFRRIPRQRYFHFISLLRQSEFLVTDSGGSQEECGYLGHPCLVHRAVTEHTTGLDGSVLLSGMDLGTVRRFLAEPQCWRRGPKPLERSPTDAIVAHLEERGFLPPAVGGLPT